MPDGPISRFSMQNFHATYFLRGRPLLGSGRESSMAFRGNYGFYVRDTLHEVGVLRCKVSSVPEVVSSKVGGRVVRLCNFDTRVWRVICRSEREVNI